MMTSYWHASALYALTRARCVQILFGSLHHSVWLYMFSFFFCFFFSIFGFGVFAAINILRVRSWSGEGKELFNVKGTTESTLVHPLRLLRLIVLLCHLSYTHLAG